MDPSDSIRKLIYDGPPSQVRIEQSAPPQTLSPVPESSSEDESFEHEDGQFSDAPEECTIGDAASAKLETTTKRDSKLEYDFAEVKDSLRSPEKPTTVEDKISPNPEQPRLGGAVVEKQPQGPDQKEGNNPHDQHAVVLSLLIAGICLAVLLVSLDRTIITTVSLVPEFSFFAFLVGTTAHATRLFPRSQMNSIRRPPLDGTALHISSLPARYNPPTAASSPCSTSSGRSSTPWVSSSWAV